MLGYFTMKQDGLRYHGYTRLYYHEICYVILPWKVLGYVTMDILDYFAMKHVALRYNGYFYYHDTKLLLYKNAMLDVTEFKHMLLDGYVSYISLAWRSICMRNIATFGCEILICISTAWALWCCHALCMQYYWT